MIFNFFLKKYFNFPIKGLALNNLNKYEEAIHNYDKAIEIFPLYAKCFYNKGISFFDLNRYEEALQ